MATDLDPNEEDAGVLWAGIHRLRAAVQGPDGYETWQQAAVAERVRRVAAEKALAAVQAPAVGEGWRPIAAAPRDGSEVLLFEVYERLPVIGWWSEKRKRWYASTEVYDTDGDATVIDKLYTDGVTHWMPLPAPPAVAEDAS